MKPRGFVILGLVAVPAVIGGLVAYGLLRLVDMVDRIEHER